MSERWPDLPLVAPVSRCAKLPNVHGWEGGKACCCNCKWHARDLHHPSTTGGNVLSIRGWACLAPEFEEADGANVFSGWPEHGLCEMWSLELFSLIEPAVEMTR